MALSEITKLKGFYGGPGTERFDVTPAVKEDISLRLLRYPASVPGIICESSDSHLYHLQQVCA